MAVHRFSLIVSSQNPCHGGHKITGLYITDLTEAKKLDNYSSTIGAGFFGVLNNATIKNLTIEEATVVVSNDAGSIYAGALAGYAGASTITDCTVSGNLTANGTSRTAVSVVAGATLDSNITNVTATGSVSTLESTGTIDMGSVAGYAASTNFTGLVLDVTENASSALDVYAGGVCGYGDSNAITDSNIITRVTASSTGSANASMAGGISGAAHNGSDSGNTVSATLTVAAVKSGYAGGAYGYAENMSSATGAYSNLVNINVTGTESRLAAGGAAGCAVNYTLDGSSTTGTITSAGIDDNSSAGVIGLATDGSITNVNSAVSVNATASAENASVMAGGIGGEITGGTYTSDTATGAISVTSSYNGYAGGAFGYINGGNYTSVNASGPITNTSVNGVTTGGFVGYANGEFAISECTGSSSRTNDGKSVYDEDMIGFDATQ